MKTEFYIIGDRSLRTLEIYDDDSELTRNSIAELKRELVEWKYTHRPLRVKIYDVRAEHEDFWKKHLPKAQIVSYHVKRALRA